MASDPWAQLVDNQERQKIEKQMQNMGLLGGGNADHDDDKSATKADMSLLNKYIHKTLELQPKTDLEILRNDPQSPLHSVKSFEALRLKKELLDGIFGMGFNHPSKIQETALPLLLVDPPQNLIAQSQSGTGKTAAFVLTMLSRVDTTQNYPQCLCLAPTYELALQIGQVTEKMSKFMTQLRIRYAVRGAQQVKIGQTCSEHLIIGTPGTLVDWAFKFRFFDPSKIRVFVLDEADVMIDTQGHQDQSIRVQRALSPNCQMLLFSATYEDQVMKFAEAIIPNPIVIRLRREEQTLSNIKQYYIMCQSVEDKYRALSNIYGSISIGQCMIFCHTKKTAGWLAGKMAQEGHAVALLSGELDVEQRAAVIERFRQGREKVLITTNVTARGIDVEQVTVVINFDLPMDQTRQVDFDTYIHRIGRTGRFGKSGLAINMVDGPQTMNMLHTLEKHFGVSIQKLDAEDMEAIEKIGNH